MISLVVVAFLVGIALAAIVALIPFSVVGVVVFGLAVVVMEPVSAVLVYVCLQAGFVAGLVLRAFAGRFRAATALKAGSNPSADTLRAQELRH
ncbi:hypothetical protein [Methylobacterium trifolii]|uniref:Uncharacterized protein n=1 Tax=Methylobacterium trifolii TaxID=1003092 RepID=A0ABQ4U8G4_9HYPH|nr:hypothetical protein [Methylobacterium trifolii]GJE62693.1 hypothetical protein MPOCJGCO_4827 [Methylobacterium trifolii]